MQYVTLIIDKRRELSGFFSSAISIALSKDKTPSLSPSAPIN